MRTIGRLLLAGLAASLLLGLAVGTASAGKLSTTSRTFRFVWRRMQFTTSEEVVLIECPVTLEGSLHSATLAKVSGALVGYMTRAQLASAACTNGFAEGATIGTESLPWHVRYEGFSGTLPNITGISLRLFNKLERFRVLGSLCLYDAVAAGMRVIASVGAGGALTRLDAEPSTALPRESGGLACPADAIDKGSATVTVLGSTSSISIRLI